MGAEAIKETQTRLNALLDFAINSESVVPDNPIYRALSERDTYQNFMPPERQSLYELYLNGRNFLDDSEYEKAIAILSELYEQDSTEENLLLLVLAQYKFAEATNNSRLLIECINSIKEKVDIDSSVSEHLLGRVAAIYLRLFNLLEEETYYYLALEYYRRGACYSRQNYYCPRNYCALLLRIYEITDDPNVIIEHYYTAKHYAKLYLNSSADALKDGSYEERVYYYYNVCDLKAIVAGEYSNYEKLQERLNSDEGISIRQRNTIKTGIEKLYNDIAEMNHKTKLF